MLFPNFLIIGAAKAGTTALHTYLQQHPQIYMTPEKETNFFAFEGEQLNFKGPGDEAINQFSITDLTRYQAEFKGITNEIAIGEACPLYLYHPQAAERIYQYNSQMRIIAILRHPIERAYANFLHLIRDDREPEKDFFKALQLEPQRIQDNWEWFWHYIQQGYYFEQLQRYYNIFQPEQIKVYLYDDFKSNPLKLIKDAFNFLEVDKSFIPDMSIRPNKSGMPKNAFMHQLLTKPNPIKTFLKPFFSTSLRQKIQHQNLSTPQISLQSRNFLLSLYQNDIADCQDLVGQRLYHWLQ